MTWSKTPKADRLFRALGGAQRAKPDPVPGPDWLAGVSRAVRHRSAAGVDRREGAPGLIRLAWRGAAVAVVVSLLLGAYALTSPGTADLGWAALIGEDSTEAMLALLVGP